MAIVSTDRITQLNLCLQFYKTPFKLFSLQKRRHEMFCKTDVLKNFAKFTGKQLCRSFFLDKVARLLV